MRSSTIVLTVGLLAAPLAFMTAPAVSGGGGNLFAEASAQDRSQSTAKAGQPLDNRTFTDAPMSKLEPEGVAPADRVAGSTASALAAGPIDGTPFSNIPSGELSEGGAGITQRDRVYTPTENSDRTPNLDR